MPPAGPVAILFHDGGGGGASLYVLRVVGELQRRGWELAFYVDRPSRVADLLEERGMAVAGRPRHVGFSLRWLRHPPGPSVKSRAMAGWFGGLGRWLRSTRPALVHANSLYALPDALLARSLGLPVHLQLHEMLPAGRKGSLARTVIRAAGVQVGAVSQASARRFAGDGPLPVIVPGGTPLPPSPARRPDRSAPPVVGTLGYVCERKGTDVFVEAARLVRQARPDVRFRIVGRNDDAPGQDWGERVLQRAAEVGIEHLPHTDDVFGELSGWDLMALPARFDPYPLSVMEAMAAGVPVVGAAVDGIVEQVAPGTGLLARPQDAGDLAAKLLELLDDDGRRLDMAAAARRHAERTFTLDRQVDALEAAWRAALGDPA